jgi:hypothetical protein
MAEIEGKAATELGPAKEFQNRTDHEFQLIRFLFVDRDDLEIVAGRFQNKRFVDLAG